LIDIMNQETVVIGELIPTKRSNQWQAKIKCCWCGKYHIHGWNPYEPEKKRIRTRVSHCYDTRKMPNKPLFSGYTIFTRDEIERGTK